MNRGTAILRLIQTGHIPASQPQGRLNFLLDISE